MKTLKTSPNATLLTTVRDLGCMYHKDDGKCPVWPAPAYYVVSGDLWCQAAVNSFIIEMTRI